MGRTKFTAKSKKGDSANQKKERKLMPTNQAITRNMKIIHARQFRHDDLINQGVTKKETYDGTCNCPFNISWQTGKTGITQRCKMYTHICR